LFRVLGGLKNETSVFINLIKTRTPLLPKPKKQVFEKTAFFFIPNLKKRDVSA